MKHISPLELFFLVFLFVILFLGIYLQYYKKRYGTRSKNKVGFIIGISTNIMAIAVLILSNTGEFGEVSYRADNFLKIMHQQNYVEASKYVDTSRISVRQLKELCSLASHYYADVTTFGNDENGTYIAGYKAIPDDRDKENDRMLDFVFKKVKGKWIVIRFELQ